MKTIIKKQSNHTSEGIGKNKKNKVTAKAITL